MRADAQFIIEKTIADVMPDKAVREKMQEMNFAGRVFIVAVGKAAWTMAKSAGEILQDNLYRGLVITKYDHAQGSLPKIDIVEAGHPMPDENSIIGAKKAIALMGEVTAQDTVLLLLSGGGSSLMELPVAGVTLEEMQDITRQLLFSGADITEINVIRKKLSMVKGGKFTRFFGQAKAYAIILSDIIGDNNDMIASGLTYPDISSAEDAKRIIEKYEIDLSKQIREVLYSSEPFTQVQIENYVVGSVKELCQSAAVHAAERGYEPCILTTELNCEAREAGKWIAQMAKEKRKKPTAIIAGGETVVKVNGNGLGGRNQELALSAAVELAGMENVILFSFGSDGTDGPTDAAGGIVDGMTAAALQDKGINCQAVLAENDSYHALKSVGGLIVTGATGTNVNDVTVMLCR